MSLAKSNLAFPIRSSHGHTVIFVTCKTCRREEEVTIRPGDQVEGLGTRVLRAKGWLLGSKRNRDVCPGCRNQKQKRNLTGPQRRAAYLAIEAEEDRKEEAAAKAVEYGPMAEALKPLKEELMTTAQLVAKGADFPVSKTFTTISAARRNMMVWFSENQVTFDPAICEVLELQKENYCWRLLSDTPRPAGSRVVGTARPRLQPGYEYTATQNAVRGAQTYLSHKGLVPTQDVNFKIVQTLNGWSFQIMDNNQSNVVAISPSALSPAGVPIAEPPRQMTRENRRFIDESIAGLYDPKKERWLKDNSDKNMAERLKVPRAWVTEVREQLYGAFDRNEAAEQQSKKLDEAIAMAEAASTRLLEMAAEAETLVKSLQVVKAKLL